MELIAINFVLEFARDLQKLLEKLEKEYGQLLVVGSAYYKKKIQERASELTEELYEKYKKILDLKIERGEEGSNIVLKNNDNGEILIPWSYINSSKFYNLKEGLEILILGIEKGNSPWSEFIFRLFQTFYYSDESLQSIKRETIEKIRFFLSFINNNSLFDYENVPEEFNRIYYQSRYTKWRKNSSFSKLYYKKIRNDRNFFQKHVNIYPIPNFPAWNLRMTYFDLEDIDNLSHSNLEKYYPIQIYESSKGKILSIIALESIGNENGQLINDFSIINNFNIFPLPLSKKKSIYPKNNSIFNSYVKFIDERDNRIINPYYNEITYNQNINFKSFGNIPDRIKVLLTRKTINEFNLLYDRKLSNFILKFIPDINKERISYRYLFNTSFFFPDFNFKDSFLLIIDKKKRNSKFNNIITFFKNWNYKTIIFELKDKFILNGFLLPKFDYTREKMYMEELFQQVDVRFKFFITGADIKQSNLSIYNLPSSNQYQEELSSWDLSKIKFPLNNSEKEQLISNQVKKEKSFIFHISKNLISIISS